MRKVAVIPVIAMAMGLSSACATKGFVHGRVGEVNERVEALSESLEETQERTRRNEARIGEVDQRVGEVDQRAAAAGRTAEEARVAAADAEARAEELDRASRRLIYEVVLSADKGNFRFGQAGLPETAKAEIDRLVSELKADPQNIYIEIEGHTDSIGPAEVNHRLGMERAEAVRRYLYEEHQVPLHKMNVISYGQDRPVAPNNTRDGRAQNRRVVIKVLA